MSYSIGVFASHLCQSLTIEQPYLLQETQSCCWPVSDSISGIKGERTYLTAAQISSVLKSAATLSWPEPSSSSLDWRLISPYFPAVLTHSFLHSLTHILTCLLLIILLNQSPAHYSFTHLLFIHSLVINHLLTGTNTNSLAFSIIHWLAC